jgi:hypothetical protein
MQEYPFFFTLVLWGNSATSNQSKIKSKFLSQHSFRFLNHG